MAIIFCCDFSCDFCCDYLQQIFIVVVIFVIRIYNKIYNKNHNKNCQKFVVFTLVIMIRKALVIKKTILIEIALNQPYLDSRLLCC